MTRYYRSLTIAGSDSGGGAGIQADLKTMSALGVYGMSVITSITAQNTCGVTAIQAIDPDIVTAQLEAVMSDIGTDSIKIGMLYNSNITRAVTQFIDRYHPENIVLDPVMISTSGHKLIEDETIKLIRDQLFGRATLITPNLNEAELLSGTAIGNEDDMLAAGEILLDMGCKAVLLKGGHLKNKRLTDILLRRDYDPFVLEGCRIETVNTHGTGCTLSSAIASFLARGEELPGAVASAKSYISAAIEAGAQVHTGNGHGPLNHFFKPTPLLTRD